MWAVEDSCDVEDETDSAIAQDCGSYNSFDSLECFIQALDHDFLSAEQIVDEQAKQLAGELTDNQQAFTDIVGARGDREPFVQPDEWEKGTTHQDHLLRSLDGKQGLRSRPEHFSNGEEGNDVAVFADNNYEAFDDCEGERQQNSERRTFAQFGFYLNPSPHALHVLAYDV